MLVFSLKILTFLDPTLTTTNVVEVVKPVSYHDTKYIISASFGKSSEMEWMFQSREQMKEALIDHTLSTHPCLSWSTIAAELQRMGYSEAAAEVSRKYVKGQSLR